MKPIRIGLLFGVLFLTALSGWSQTQQNNQNRTDRSKTEQQVNPDRIGRDEYRGNEDDTVRNTQRNGHQPYMKMDDNQDRGTNATMNGYDPAWKSSEKQGADGKRLDNNARSARQAAPAAGTGQKKKPGSAKKGSTPR